MKVTKVLIFASALFIGLSSQAEVYKWVDENGRVHYGDKPPEDKLDGTSSKPVVYDAIDLPKNANLPSSAILSLRKMFDNHQFHKMNELLNSYQLLVERDISNESRLYKTYDAFDLYDKKYDAKFDAWINTTPNNYQPYLARASFYYSLGWKYRGGRYSSETKPAQFRAMKAHFAKARTDIEKVISLNDRSMVAYSILIGMAQATGDKHDAKNVIQKALTISPASFLVREHYINSLTPRWNGSYKKMEEFAKSAQAYVNENKKLKELLGLHILDAADTLYLDGRYKKAEKLLKLSMHYNNNNRYLFLNGKNYYRQGEFGLALENFTEAIRLQPEDGNYYYWRSKTYTKLKQYGSSLTDIERAAALVIDDEQINKRHQWLVSQVQLPGVVTKTSKQLEPEFEKVIAQINQDPNNAFLYYKKAGMFLQKNQPQRALTDIKKAIELAPDKFEYYYILDLAAFKLNRLDEIIQYWEKYIALKPDDSRAYLERSGTYYHKRDIPQAMRDAKKALDLGNKNAEKAYLKLKGMLEPTE